MDRFQNRRKNYYINKKFQREFIMKFCALVIFGAVLSGSIIYLLSRSTTTAAFVNSRLVVKSTADYILPSVLLASAVVIAVIGIATVIVTLLVSHRIAGPLYRIEKDVSEITSGNLAVEFRLRTGDELKALAVSMDLMARSLKDGFSVIKRSADGLASAIERGDAEAIKKNLAALKANLGRFKT